VPKGNHLRNGGHLDGVVTRLQGRLTALPSKLRGIISG
jgi:hypothetical protein